MKKRILFLMSDTGGGHRAAAQAIAEAVHYLYPNSFETCIEDIWRGHTPWPINKIPNSYPWLTGPGTPLWKLMWSGSAHLQTDKIILPVISPVTKRKVVDYLKAVQPDIVVSVHPLMNHLGFRWMRQAGLNLPFVTVVTDLVTIHPLWICPHVTLCLVPTPAARQMAIKLGMSPARVKVCGQPVALKFLSLPRDKTALRKKLGLDLERQAVLVVGGGEGFGPVFEIARAIARQVPQAQLLVVTGRNSALKQKLQTVHWEIPARIYGFVTNMPELMAAADVLVTKAGPGTISEAFIAGLPPLLSGYIPGQEAGNVAYVQEHQAGAYAESPAEIAGLISEWLNPESTVLQQLARNAAQLARPEASLEIAVHICRLVRRGGRSPKSPAGDNLEVGPAVEPSLPQTAEVQ